MSFENDVDIFWSSISYERRTTEIEDWAESIIKVVCGYKTPIISSVCKSDREHSVDVTIAYSSKEEEEFVKIVTVSKIKETPGFAIVGERKDGYGWVAVYNAFDLLLIDTVKSDKH